MFLRIWYAHRQVVAALNVQWTLTKNEIRHGCGMDMWHSVARFEALCTRVDSWGAEFCLFIFVLVHVPVRQAMATSSAMFSMGTPV